MTTRLKLYKSALRLAGERTIASLTEDREPRRLLDEVWDDGGVDACLESGQWKFAMRTIQSDYDADISPEFGYKRAHQKPSDWVVTSAMSEDEYFTVPLIQVVDENGWWFLETDTIYIRYISNHTDWGNDLSIWPQAFSDYVAAHFARDYVFKLTSDKERRVEAVKWEDMAKLKAKNVDAMGDPTKFPAEGFWSRSRRTGRRERGNRNSLLG